MLLRMHPDDRATYGGPDLLDTAAAVEALNDLTFDELAILDDEVVFATGMGLIKAIGLFSTWRLQPTRVRLWLGLRHAGTVLKLNDFKPAKILKTDLEIRKDGDAGPPASTPGSLDTSTSATIPASAPSGSASTPGPRARTGSSRRPSGR